MGGAGSTTGYFGNESSGTLGAKNLIDLVATWHVSDAVTLAVNYDNLRVKDVPGVGTVKSDGFALYGNFAFSDQWRLAVRVEQMKDDKNGMLTSTADGKVKEGTLTLGFAPQANSEIRLELRKDKASSFKPFTENNGTKAVDSQNEVALQAFYKF